MNVWNGCRCISFYFIIKPQPSLTPSAMRYVVYHSISSSNHNYWTYHRRTFRLYIILFHHQTTTPIRLWSLPLGCISFYFIIKPQPEARDDAAKYSCISFYFIIKPQLMASHPPNVPVVYHSISSSNHNTSEWEPGTPGVVYHSISSSNHNIGLETKIW